MIYLASDHGGFEFKQEIKSWLLESGHECTDLGVNELNPIDDYPDFVIPLAQKIALEERSLGIIFGRSGNGEAITANKVKGVRAVLCFNEKMAQMARTHNNANILSLGADYLPMGEAKKIITTFLETEFIGEERHVRRLQKIKDLENGR